MSKLRNCLTKSNFSKEDEAKIISLSETYKQQGDSDLVAETKAIHDFHKGLVEDLNKLKSELRLPVQKYETPTVEPKYKPEEKPQENGEQPTKVPENREAAKESAAEREKPTEGGAAEPTEEATRKTIKLRVGTKKANRKLKSPALKRAAALDVYNPTDYIMQKFINGAQISRDAIIEFYGGGKTADNKAKQAIEESAPQVSKTRIKKDKGALSEARRRIDYARTDAPNFAKFAHAAWESFKDEKGIDKYDAHDFLDALEDVINSFTHRSQMAEDLNQRYTEKKDYTYSPEEEVINEEVAKAEQAGIGEAMNGGIDALESLSDSTLIELNEKPNEFTQFLIDDGILPIEPSESDIISDDGEEAPFQKKKPESATDHIADVVKHIQKVLPKVKVVYDENLDAAGQMKGDTILINPYYAGTDTPIHEAAHVLLDAMGENKVVMAAVEQLKGTDLWKETKERYPELSEKALANEVLAEAIGREGAGIFKTESEKSQFKAYLTYIFNWLKQKLGLDKNIAKSLAKQIIGGIGTKELTGISTKNQNVSDEVKYAEKEFKKAEDELKASKNAFDAKRKELDKGLIADAEDLFGERKSNADMGLFDERASVSARNEAVAPLKARYEKAQEDYKKAKEKLEQARSKPGSQQSLFQKKYGKAFTQFREEKLGRDVAQTKKDLAEFKRMLNEDDLSPEEETVIEDIIRGIRQQFEDDKDAYDEFLNQMDNVEEVFNADDLEGFTLDELIEAYNTARNYDGYADKKMLEAVKQKIAIYMSETRRKELRKNVKFIEENANKKDLRWKDIWFKTLSHMTQDFPELQALSNLFDESFLEMQEERVALKTKAKRLADAVIKEKNKQLGLGQRVGAMFSSDNARYFEYMDEGGKLRTNTTGLSKAQIELLDFVRETTKNRQVLDEKGNVIEDDILKIDKTFSENFRESGLMKAVGDYMGGNHADVEVTYVNPLTDKVEKATYADAEKAILEYAKRGVAQKGLALAKLLKLAYKAKANATNNGYSLGNGRLVSKFDKPREQGKGYSKDFYNALVQYIDDYTHVKHMNKFVPIVDSLEMLAQRGYEEQLAKPNVVKWLKEWKEEQLYRKPKETDPIIDAALKTLRTLTSQIVMGFNIGAAGMNVFVGNYNNWRKDAADLGWFGLKSGLVGNKRFASKKGIALLKKYDVVKTDVDSYPTFKIGRAFQNLAHAAQSYGEMQIQGSMFLSQLTEQEWNSFEMKNGELVLKDTADKKEINRKFAQYKNKVSDVQGKYSEKDRRNFMRGELGKIASQFKVWMPDAWKERFGKEYINSHGETVRGTYRILMADSLAELRKQVMTKEFWTSKEMKSNLRGAMLIALVLVARYQDNDDEKKRRKAMSLDNALGNLLFVFDTDQLKYLAKSPVAALGTVTKFLDSFQDAVNMDVDKFEKDAQKVVPYGKLYSDVKDLTTEE